MYIIEVHGSIMRKRNDNFSIVLHIFYLTPQDVIDNVLPVS